MGENTNLTQGSILRKLLKLALPIIGMSFVQMAYTMVDMGWLGRVGSDAVAAVGTAGFFVWIGISFLLTTRIGAEVGISQSIGAKNFKKAEAFAVNAIIVALAFSTVYGLASGLLSNSLIESFNIKEPQVNEMAIKYLQIISIGAPLYYCNQTYSGIYNGAGRSLLPFLLNSIGLLINLVIDPLFIFGLGDLFPALGSSGAAIATIISQGIVAILFWMTFAKGYSVIKFRRSQFKLNKKIILDIVKFGAPVGAHSLLFAIFAMQLVRIIAPQGALPIAIQNIGAQIESISWMTAEGLSTALSAFTGQNFGARKWERMKKGLSVTLGIAIAVGLLTTSIFLFLGEYVIATFIPETAAIELGTIYLSIVAISQVFMCVEIATGGFFFGIGKSLAPSVVGISFTGIRIPISMYIVATTTLGITGVWWTISLTSVCKGIILLSLGVYTLFKMKEILKKS